MRDPLHRLAEAPVEVADGAVEPLPDLALDVALDPLGVVRGEPGHEMAGVGHRRDAVADGKPAPEILLGGIVLDAEQLAEVEAGLADAGVVVIDEAGASAHHAFAQPVHEFGVAPVVGHREQPAPLVVPGKGLGIMLRTCFADGGGERGEGGLGQQALVVAPGAGAGVVVDGDVVGGLAVVQPARPGGDAQRYQHGVVGEIHLFLLL